MVATNEDDLADTSAMLEGIASAFSSTLPGAYEGNTFYRRISCHNRALVDLGSSLINPSYSLVDIDCGLVGPDGLVSHCISAGFILLLLNAT